MVTNKIIQDTPGNCESDNRPAKKITRRKFIQNAAVTVGTVVVGSELMLQKPAKAQTTTRLGMVIDLRKCVGCKSCTIACKAENHTPPGIFYNTVDDIETGTYPNVQRSFMTKPCNQCENPPCVPVCPVDATYKRSDGVVVIDYDVCIGCQMCVPACPYGVRKLDSGDNYHDTQTLYEEVASPEYGEFREREPNVPPIGKVRKCSFCIHRVLNGLSPACAETCIGRAIHFGDLGDSAAVCQIHGENLQDLLASRDHMRLLESAGTEPNVYYLT